MRPVSITNYRKLICTAIYVTALCNPSIISGQAYGDQQATPVIGQVPRPDHIVLVIEENKSYGQIIGNKAAEYLNQLAGNGAVFDNSFAITHPSQPNYLALFSGSTHGVTNDQCPINVAGENLGSELQKKGLSFAIYSESMPTVGYEGCFAAKRLYVRKHNPAVNWQGKNLRPEANMPFDLFPSDFSKLPTVSILIPNQINNMHDGRTISEQITRGDVWLRNNLNSYVRWAQRHNSLLIITWDEDDGLGNNHIATIFAGPMVKAGSYHEHIDHYDVLRTIGEMYGLSPMGNTANAEPVTNTWNRVKQEAR
jgi:phosphatidylinositol-3-phosphatase